MARPKVGIISLGCPRNLVDSQEIIRNLTDKGHSLVELKDAQIALVNTCAFIEEAKRESIDVILELLELKKAGRLKKVIVTGCLPQRYKEELAQELPEVDAFIGKIALGEANKPGQAHTARGKFSLTPGHYAYLKICEGCVHKCSFCAIPGIKGKFTSAPAAGIFSQVKAWDREKISELCIIGQDITGYGRDLRAARRLPQLLREIVRQAPHIRWFRLLYLYPNSVVDEVCDIMRDEPRVCRYIDVPVQHINDRILRLMRRATSRKSIIALIERIRKKLPTVALRTSVIVGFPTETEKEFNELMEFIREIKFERLGAFIYSREEGTPAFSFPGQIPRRIKLARFDKVMQLQQEVALQVNKRFLGQQLEVLIDEEESGAYVGRSQYDAPEVDGVVYVKSQKPLTPGDFVQVNITDTLEYDLVGEVA